MATSGDQEENERSFNLDEALKSFRQANKDEDDDSDSESEGVSGDLTMFCKTCLNPYCGEQKAGTIVLRCEKCGQTDTVLEEQAADLNPEEWIGNLMMNRFMQVLKEQEDLGLNIADPHYADDEFKRYALAIAEYSFNIRTLSEHLHRVVTPATILKDAMESVTDEELAEVENYRNSNPEEFEAEYQARKQRYVANMENLMNSKTFPVKGESSKSDDATPCDIVASETVEAEASAVGQTVDNDTIPKGTEALNDAGDSEMVAPKADADTNKTELESDSKAVSDMETVDASAVKSKRQSESESNDDGPSDKHEGNEDEKVEDENSDSKSNDYDSLTDWLPASFRKQLKELPSTVVSLIQTLITKYELPQEIYDNVMDKVWNRVPEESCKKVETSDVNVNTTLLEDDLSEEKAGDMPGNAEVKDCVKSKVKDTDTEKDVANMEGTSDDDDDNDEFFFNISKKKLKNEVFGTLYPKFSVKFQSKEEEADEEANEMFNKGTVEKKQVAQPKCEDHVYGEGNKQSKDTVCREGIVDNFQTHESASASSSNVETTVNSKKTDEPGQPGAKPLIPEGTTFHAVSSAFMSEMQKRKHKALIARKDKALAVINEKIALLKREVESVEEKVRDELTQAYANKVKKVEKQRKQLDARHQHIQEVEDLLTYYARTGQAAKLAELMDQLDIQYEN